MSLTEQDIKKVARLARIKVAEEDLSHWKSELSSIFGWIDQLQQIDTTGVENYTDFKTEGMPEREDVVSDGGHPEAILSNAPDQEYGMFAVPKVIE